MTREPRRFPVPLDSALAVVLAASLLPLMVAEIGDGAALAALEAMTDVVVSVKADQLARPQ